MTTYKALKGKKVKFLASDPPAAVAEGQVWYNGADYKTSVKEAAWANGGNLGTARYGGGSAGTQTAALYMSGGNAPIVTNVEKYDGSSWSAETVVPAGASKTNGAGTQTAALMIGGGTPWPATTNTLEFTGAGATLTKTIETD